MIGVEVGRWEKERQKKAFIDERNRFWSFSSNYRDQSDAVSELWLISEGATGCSCLFLNEKETFWERESKKKERSSKKKSDVSDGGRDNATRRARLLRLLRKKKNGKKGFQESFRTFSKKKKSKNHVRKSGHFEMIASKDERGAFNLAVRDLAIRLVAKRMVGIQNVQA